MKKFSAYNIIVPFHKGYSILYNSVSGFYSLLTPRTAALLEECGNDASHLAADHPRLYTVLENNGCIIPDDLDEFEVVETMKFERRFSGEQYQLIVNTTMDCNLGCWYCYENHIPGSAMDVEVAENILKHLSVKYARSPFKVLIISFFGGEPLLNEKRVLEIIDGAEVFCKEKNINLSLDFTTNCTVLSDTLLDRLKGMNVSFQITLDGDREKHNTIRRYKNSTDGTYDRILANTKRITDRLDKYVIRLRLNCDNKTLENGTDILDSIDFLDRERSVIGIQRIWQVEEDSVDKGRILEFIKEASLRNFKVDFMQLACLKENVCYADLFNEAVINYDGSVFKCTAREFSPEGRDGVLTGSGHIVWNIDKIRRRMFLTTPEICRGCKLLPACTGLCSQHLIESGGMKECRLLKDLSLEEHITINFQQRFLQNNFIRL